MGIGPEVMIWQVLLGARKVNIIGKRKRTWILCKQGLFTRVQNPEYGLYIYIYIYRERERERESYVHPHAAKLSIMLTAAHMRATVQ